MSKDIRSYFTVISKKSGNSLQQKNVVTPKKTRTKKRTIIESDDEDFIADTPEQDRAPKKKKPEIIDILDSDSEGQKKLKNKKTSNAKLKQVNVSDVFKSTPIQQSKVKVSEHPVPEEKPKKVKEKKPKNNPEVNLHEDISFQQTLLELDDDDDLFINNMDLLDKTASEAFAGNNSTADISQLLKEAEVDNCNNENVGKQETNEKKRHRLDASMEFKGTPKKKQKIEHTDSGIDPDQEAYEKKRYSAMLYERYKKRGGPRHHGAKELPKGKRDCLKNLCFLRTGVMDSLESEEFESLIKEHGGRTVHAVSKKVNYLVVGEDAGPAKLAKAESYNIPTISEDELLDMILTKSGMEAKYCKNSAVRDSEDLGVDVDFESNEDFNADNKSPNKKDELDSSTTQANKVKSPKEKVSLHKLKDKNITIEAKKFYDTASASTSKETVRTGGQEKLDTHRISEGPKRDSSCLSLTDKYQPQNVKAVVGQQGDGSVLNKLKKWLMNWDKSQRSVKQKLLKRPSPWDHNSNGGYFTCALLSGPPGIGKSTMATLVSKELGLDIVEFNASDTRSKKLLNEEVSQLLNNKTIAGFATGKSNVHKNRVLLMDEVDGMAGNEDRGGVQALIQLIKNTNIPIICMCNDRNHPKIKSLVNYCYDLRVTRPKLEQIRGAMMSVCFKEGIKISPSELTQLITATGCDIRQTLNHLSLWSSCGAEMSTQYAEKEAKNAKKDAVMGPWEVCRAVFTETEKETSFADKSRLFFYDYSIGPLFVQENYLKVGSKGNAKRTLLGAAFAADCISMGDLIDRKIRSTNNWALLESQAFFSSVFPGYFMRGQFNSQITFPAWLGKNSKKNKFSRIFTELQTHTRTTCAASKLAMKLDYLKPLRGAILRPLKNGMEGVQEAVDVMKTYNLLREDLDNLLELSKWERGKNQNDMNQIESKVKAAFTRAYNKQVTLLPYAPTSGVSKKKNSDQGYNLEEEDGGPSDEEDDISKNSMIKIKNHGRNTSKENKSTKNSEEKKGKGKKAKSK